MLETNKDSFGPIAITALALVLAPFVIGLVTLVIDTFQRLAR